MRENGLVSRLEIKWLPKKPICESDGRDFTMVGIIEIKPILIAYFIGFVLSGVLLIFEIIYTIFTQMLKEF